MAKYIINARGRLYAALNGISTQEELQGAFYVAVEKNKLEVVELLLEAGADVHVDNDYALKWASMNGYEGVVRLLLEAGADVHADNDLALGLASANGHEGVVKILKEYKKKNGKKNGKK